MNLAAPFAVDAVGLLVSAVCVLDPRSARRRLDLEAHARLDALRPPHGWVGERRPNGRIWYSLRRLDTDGFEQGGRSQFEPPPGVDPATIPLVDQGPGFPLAQRLEQTRQLVAVFRPGVLLHLGLIGRFGVAEDLGAARARLEQRLNGLEAIIADGYARAWRDRWLSAVSAGEPPEDPAAAGFALDADVSGLARLMQAAAPAAAMLPKMFAAHVEAFRMAAPADQLAILIMYLRKARVPDLPQRMAEHFMAEARTAWQAGLAAPDLAGLVRAMFAAAQSAELSRRIWQDIIGFAGDQAPPLWRKSANVAEEWVVRASGSVSNAFENLEARAWARHRHSVTRAEAAGGAARAQARVTELIEMHWFYPRAWATALAAAPPVEAVEEDVLGPAYAAEYLGMARYLA